MNINDSTNNFFMKFPGQTESIRQLSSKLLATPTPKVRNSTFKAHSTGHKTKRGTKERKTTVEIAVFFDSAAFRIFAPHFNYDNNKIRDMLLAYINGVIIYIPKIIQTYPIKNIFYRFNHYTITRAWVHQSI